MTIKTEPIFNDSFTGEPPAKRAVGYIQGKREKGKHVAGIYCGYAPVELLYAMDIVPAVLCAFANATIEEAESVLPANLCPLIKSSYGFISKDTCPFYSFSEAVIGETTCDGKKKMFELISEKKPMHVMDLPQLPDEAEALNNWTVMITKLQSFLEKTFDVKATTEDIRKAITENNKKNDLVTKILEFGALPSPVIGWTEMHDVIFLATPARGNDIYTTLEGIIAKLEDRVKQGYVHGAKGSPRILVTGCPTAGDAAKVFKIIEETGGVIVAIDSCVGLKPFAEKVEEGTADPIRSIAERYLKIPCACMTPNNGRIAELDKLIDKYKPDAVIDIVLQACHGYNIESYKTGEHVMKKRNLPFLKVVTDYSQGDTGQIKTRIEALLESI
ncbi:MAG TPA: double-cubane-cluster-containing anaerobic reductase [Spirochaetota bacterium]|nr:double-cubane-cluster-containing anaerobic reductase [Spirochaetota bacterium]HPS87308.1 double-cubane-cluster-containing anaerobic reductase [Spirochaetota bacterium]